MGAPSNNQPKPIARRSIHAAVHLQFEPVFDFLETDQFCESMTKRLSGSQPPIREHNQSHWPTTYTLSLPWSIHPQPCPTTLSGSFHSVCGHRLDRDPPV